MASSEEFQPDWTSAPGDTIVDILNERDISQTGFASLMGLTAQASNDLLQGQSTVSIAMSRRLSDVLGASVEYWMSRDYQYRQDSKWVLEIAQEWIRKLPLEDMIKFGWLTPPFSPSEELKTCLQFFGVSSVLEWREAYSSIQEMAAFRSSSSFEAQHESVAAWLRQGEIEAATIACRPWNPKGFQESLKNIRTLTRQKDPSRFLPTLQKLCAENGVAVVIVRSPSGCRASGATRFTSKDKAILQLSFRYLTDDHFWFTFFHEAGHLILHENRHLFSADLEGRRTWILEGDEFPATEEEREANQFSATTLVPLEYQPELLNLPLDHKKVIRFAVRVGVSPGVIVGQLQHHGRIGYNQLNRLKRHFAWQD